MCPVQGWKTSPGQGGRFRFPLSAGVRHTVHRDGPSRTGVATRTPWPGAPAAARPLAGSCGPGCRTTRSGTAAAVPGSTNVVDPALQDLAFGITQFADRGRSPWSGHGPPASTRSSPVTALISTPSYGERHRRPRVVTRLAFSVEPLPARGAVRELSHWHLPARRHSGSRSGSRMLPPRSRRSVLCL